MGNVYVAVIFLLCTFQDADPTEEICAKPEGFNCNAPLIKIDDAEICYTNKGGRWYATIECKNGTLTGPDSYSCKKNKPWTQSLTSSCVLEGTTTTASYIQTSISTIDRTEVPVSEQSTSNASIPPNTTNKSESVTTPSPNSPVGNNETSKPTTKVTTNTTNESTNESSTSLSATNNILGLSDDDDNGSVVAAAVTVPVIFLIAIAVVIALFLWRRRRLKSTSAIERYPGVSITNKNYEHGHALDRRISLLNMRTSDSIDSGYTEIALENSDPVETTGSIYQTIDSLPEDQAECSSGYGHLKMQTTKFIDKNYSHFPINQTNGNATRDTTYAHTENATNEQVVNDNRDDNDNTYNKLETTLKTNTGKHIPEKQEEGNEDADAEYNHATAGLPDLTPEDKADTYSHLNSTLQKTQAHPKNSFELFTQNAKPERKEKQPMAYEFQKESETGPYEFENSSGGKKLQNVGPDDYETAAIGPVHDYFVLEPENGPSGTEISFRVLEDNAEEKDNDYECAKHHQYFTLEKTET